MEERNIYAVFLIGMIVAGSLFVFLSISYSDKVDLAMEQCPTNEDIIKCKDTTNSVSGCYSCCVGLGTEKCSIKENYCMDFCK